MQFAEMLFLQHAHEFFPVMGAEGRPYVPIDLSKQNLRFTSDIFNDSEVFSQYINKCRSVHNGRKLWGGYAEDRAMYKRSDLFAGSEPRCIHLGIDIWADFGDEVYLPLDGIIHSFAYNNKKGDYGGTIITQHGLDGFVFHLLFGHLSLQSLNGLQKNQPIKKGSMLARLGMASENGDWPPHLHFQVIINLEGMSGDYPGVCSWSKKSSYLVNCPDPFRFI